MTRLRSLIRRFARDESGAALAEYAAIFLVLAVAGTVILVTVGETLADIGEAIDGWLRGNVLTPFTAGGGGGG